MQTRIKKSVKGGREKVEAGDREKKTERQRNSE